MKRRFLLLLCVSFVLNGARVSLAQGEPDWYPRNSITPEIAKSIASTFTRSWRPLKDDELSPSPDGRVDFAEWAPKISLWDQSIRLVIRLDTKNIYSVAASTDLSSELDFLKTALPVSVTIDVAPVPSVSSDPIDFNNGNFLIEYTSQHGYRHPYFDNPLRMQGRYTSSRFPIFCTLMCQVVLAEPADDGSYTGSFCADCGNGVLMAAEAQLQCCRLVEKDGTIIGAQYYNYAGIPDVAALQSERSKIPSPEQMYLGELRRVLVSVASGLGARRLEPGQPIFIFSPSPSEISESKRSGHAIMSVQPFERSSEESDSQEEQPDLFGVCSLPQHQYSDMKLTSEIVSTALAPECLSLHRTVAMLKLLHFAGVKSGMTPDMATVVLTGHNTGNNKGDRNE